MAQRRKGEKRTKKRELKLKKQKAQKAAMPVILRRDPLLGEVLRCHHPLHSCLINENWRDVKMATIYVVRETPHGLTMVSFLVDLLGFGIKDVWGNYGITLMDIATIKSQSADDALPLTSCDLARASSIIHGSIEWAKKWGMKLPRDYKVWMRILEPLDADGIDRDLFGVDGKPLVMVDEDDDHRLFDDFEVDMEVLKNPFTIEGNSPSRKLLERIGDIKGTLVTFSGSPEFQAEFTRARSEYFQDVDPPKDMDGTHKISFLDWYTLERKSEFGDTFPDRFVEAYGDRMSGDVREMILGWRNVIDGIFEIKGKRSGGFHLYNLINEREYTVYPTASMEDAPSLEIGDFMAGRIVPIRNFHTFSGIIAKMPCDGSEKERGSIYRIAIETQTRYPRKAFQDNEEKLKKSIELARKAYDEFVGYFGSDELVGTGREMVQKHQDFLRYTAFDIKDPRTGLSKAEQYARERGKEYHLPRTDFPETLLKSPDVGMVCAPLEGVTFLEEWGLFTDIFKNPGSHTDGWIKRRHTKNIIKDYLESDSISDMPFRRMAAQYPDNFVQVMRYVLKWQEFSIDMIDDLIRKYKPKHGDGFPTTVALLDSEMLKYASLTEE